MLTIFLQNRHVNVFFFFWEINTKFKGDFLQITPCILSVFYGRTTKRYFLWTSKLVISNNNNDVHDNKFFFHD